MDYGKWSFSFIFLFQAFCCEINVILMELIYLSFNLGALYCEIKHQSVWGLQWVLPCVIQSGPMNDLTVFPWKESMNIINGNLFLLVLWILQLHVEAMEKPGHRFWFFDNASCVIHNLLVQVVIYFVDLNPHTSKFWRVVLSIDSQMANF